MASNCGWGEIAVAEKSESYTLMYIDLSCNDSLSWKRYSLASSFKEIIFRIHQQFVSVVKSFKNFYFLNNSSKPHNTIR